MIKIKINGFEVEVDSIQDARSLIGSTEDKPKVGRPFKTFSDTAVEEQKSKKISKMFSKKSSWTDSELVHIVTLIEEERTPGQISRDVQLRARHNEGGILQMYRKFTGNNDNQTMSKAVRDVIIKYKNNNKPVRA